MPGTCLQTESQAKAQATVAQIGRGGSKTGFYQTSLVTVSEVTFKG